MKKSLLDLMLKVAKSSLNVHMQLRHFPHWSFIVQDNKLVDWGTNVAGTVEHYGCYHARISDGNPKIHSEIQSYRRARGLLNRNRSWEIVNIRLNRSSELRLSKPCKCCVEFLIKNGCTKMWFSSESGWLRL